MAKRFLGFTPSQQHVLLSKLGYTGPADKASMEKFIQSNPAAAAKMGNYTQKAMERLNPQPQMATGGMVKKPTGIDWENQGGDDDNVRPPATVTPPATTPPPANPAPGQVGSGGASGGPVDEPKLETPEQKAEREKKEEEQRQKAFQESTRKSMENAFSNPMDLITKATPGQITENANQFIDPATGQVRDPLKVNTQTVDNIATATAPTQTKTNTVDATKVSGKINAALDGMQAAQAKPSDKATVQGQLADLMKDFEGGGTPPWASGAMRAAMATMQSRGLGASSMAGQAIVQAAMESAIGIASQDAATVAQFEMKNLDNRQQTLIFKTQARITGLLSDQAAENAAKQFNASSKNQTDQFFAGLQTEVAKFNADQINAIRQFNAGEKNAGEKFNIQMKSATDQFNAQNSLIIAQANAQWRQTIATTNTQLQHDANMQNAQLATGMTEQAMDALWQRERDMLAYAFQGSESALDRSLQLMLGEMDYELGTKQLKAEEKEGWGQIVGTIFGKLFG